MKTLSNFIRTPMRTLALALTLWLALLPQANAAITPAWKQSAARPAAVRVDVSAVVFAPTNQTVAVSLNGVLLDKSTADSAAECVSNSYRGSVWLKPYTPVLLALAGEQVKSADFTLKPQQPMNLGLTAAPAGGFGGASPRPVVPDRYLLYIGGTQAVNVAFSSSTCIPYVTNWVVELRPDHDQQRLNSVGRDQETDVAENSAPGDGEWPSIGPAKTPNTNEVAIQWSVGLGRLLGGKSAGRLSLTEFGLSPDIYTPRVLSYRQPITNLDPAYERIVVVTNVQGQLEQILTPQTLVQIASDPASTWYEVQFHRLANVDCTPTTGPFEILVQDPYVVWRFVNTTPNLADCTDLRIEEQRGGVVYTSDIHFDGTATWSLTRGTGGDLRIETRSIGFTNDAASSLYRVETNEVHGLSNQLAFRCVEAYRFFDWGCDLVSVATGTDQEALTQTFDYYEDSNAPTSYGKLRTIRYPDGYWERRFYHNTNLYSTDSQGPPSHQFDGELAWVMSPWENAPADPESAHPVINLACQGWEGDPMASTSGKGLRYDYFEGAGPQTGGVTCSARLVSVNSVASDSPWLGLYIAQRQGPWVNSSNGVTRESSGLSTSGTRNADQASVRYPNGASSEVAGQVSWAQTNYTLLSSNSFLFGTFSNGAFCGGLGRAWRMVSDHGTGLLNDSTGGFEPDWFELVPGQSTRDCLVRRDGALVCHEFYALTNHSTNVGMVLFCRDDYSNDPLGHPICQTRVNGASAGNGRVVHAWDWQGTNSVPGPLLLAETDEDGRRLRYSYDSLKRLHIIEATNLATAGFPSQPSVFVTFQYDAMNRLVRTQTNAGGLTLASSTVFDLNGRRVAFTDHQGLVTQTSYASGGRATTITRPSGAVTVQSNYLSRQLASTIGDAEVPRYYDYAAADQLHDDQRGPESGVLTINCVLGGLTSPRFERTSSDGSGATVAVVRPGLLGDMQTSFFLRRRNALHGSILDLVDDLVAAVVDPGPDSVCGGSTFYAYDAFRNVQHVWTWGAGAACSQEDYRYHLNSSNAPCLRSSDRVFTTNRSYTIGSQGDVFWTVTGLTYLTNNSDTPTVLSVTSQRLTGLASNVKSEITTTDVDGRTQIETTYVDREAAKVTRVTSASWSSLCATQIWVNGLLQSESTLTVARPTVYGYDALRRPTSATSPLGASRAPGTGPPPAKC